MCARRPGRTGLHLLSPALAFLRPSPRAGSRTGIGRHRHPGATRRDNTVYARVAMAAGVRRAVVRLLWSAATGWTARGMKRMHDRGAHRMARTMWQLDSRAPRAAAPTSSCHRRFSCLWVQAWPCARSAAWSAPGCPPPRPARTAPGSCTRRSGTSWCR